MPSFLFFSTFLIHAIIKFIKFVIKILAVSFFSPPLFLMLLIEFISPSPFPFMLFPFLFYSALELTTSNCIPLIVIFFISPPLLIVFDILIDFFFLITHILFSFIFPFEVFAFTHSFLLFLAFSFHAPTCFRFPSIISI